MEIMNVYSQKSGFANEFWLVVLSRFTQATSFSQYLN